MLEQLIRQVTAAKEVAENSIAEVKKARVPEPRGPGYQESYGGPANDRWEAQMRGKIFAYEDVLVMLEQHQVNVYKPAVEHVGEELLMFLDELRDGGSVNMFEAVPYIMTRFGLGKEDSQKALRIWMDSYKERADNSAKKEEK